ncbi:hypothetical protein EVAR_19347_1 [Eumeta japonica]|uniref:Uncharacterized protein n=1 Tax=Eumeta variegata TaxID=151549 RepID=A0A4C1TRE2_EUMVA|nr:hypothetical protein EVAR_19347_1 [Eumeta japonica]
MIHQKLGGHGYSQPHRNYWCVAGLLSRNGVFDGRRKKLMEKEVKQWKASGSLELSLTRRYTPVEAITSCRRCINMHLHVAPQRRVELCYRIFSTSLLRLEWNKHCSSCFASE